MKLLLDMNATTAAPALESGAIVTIHEDRSRLRILSLRPRNSEAP